MSDIKFDFLNDKPQALNSKAKEYAMIFVKKDKLKTHQLRNVFSSIEKMRTAFKRKKQYDDEIEMDLIMLKPKIAYAAGRQKSVKNNFYYFVEAAIDAVEIVGQKRSEGNEEEQKANQEAANKALQKFFALMESVVGYHKFYES